jgi:hypothetical protein
MLPPEEQLHLRDGPSPRAGMGNSFPKIMMPRITMAAWDTITRASVMKSRYNCALPPESNKSRAEDYKFVYHHVDDEEEDVGRRPPCDLDEVIRWLGGPTGLGRALLRSGIGRPTVPPYNQVMLHGDSRMRQVLEALICRYMDKITNLTLTFESTDMSMHAGWRIEKKRANHPQILQSNETGKPRSIDMIANESDGLHELSRPCERRLPWKRRNRHGPVLLSRRFGTEIHGRLQRRLRHGGVRPRDSILLRIPAVDIQ